MKFVPAQLSYFIQSHSTRRNILQLARYFLFLLALVLTYTVLFHVLMRAEGQQHSWVTGLYWTLTVMTTLGFGDITFQSDIGRFFSLVVLLSGVLFLLVVLPFAFIQLFYAPWLEAQSRMRAPREVPADLSGHVILTHYDPVAISLIERLKYHGKPYVVMEPDVNRALDLFDRGIKVVVGERDSVETYRRLGTERAALVAATGDDYTNTNTAFTVREVSPSVPIVSVSRAPDSVDIMQLAGSSHVINLPTMLGRALSRRTLGGDVRANVIGRFGRLLIAEAPVTETPWVGKTLAESRLREATGLTVVGLWERGVFHVPHPDTTLEPTTVLVLAGTSRHLDRFAELTAIYNVWDAPVLIIGGGRVGRAAAAALKERDVPYRIIEKKPEAIRDPETYVLGDAADRDCLERAGIMEAPTTIITTNDDPTNIYLTIYCRRLRPDMQIVSRSTLERNVSTLHRAGADFVMSYASMGANAIYNVLEQDDVVMLAEGLDVFRYPVPRQLVGKSLAESRIRERTECSVVALELKGKVTINPPPDLALPEGAELILIGTTQGEEKFVQLFEKAAA
ncbi:MAG TPA: NAD-binding protein [Longimicrobiaceae bacterium]